MKGRYYQIPIYLLSGSLVVLVIMFVVRGLSNGNQSSRTDQAPTAVEVMITSTSTESPLPTETPTLEPTSTILADTETELPTATDTAAPVPDEGCNVAGFLGDVTILDGEIIDPGTKFTKTWLLKNDGNCTWNTNYKLYYYSGDKMSGPDSQQLVYIPVPPGTSIEISVDLNSPEQAGTYKGYWALKDPEGNHFGISSFKNPFYLEIIVE